MLPGSTLGVRRCKGKPYLQACGMNGGNGHGRGSACQRQRHTRKSRHCTFPVSVFHSLVPFPSCASGHPASGARPVQCVRFRFLSPFPSLAPSLNSNLHHSTYDQGVLHRVLYSLQPCLHHPHSLPRSTVATSSRLPSMPVPPLFFLHRFPTFAFQVVHSPNSLSLL